MLSIRPRCLSLTPSSRSGALSYLHFLSPAKSRLQRRPLSTSQPLRECGCSSNFPLNSSPTESSAKKAKKPLPWTRAHIAFGSNIGDRVGIIAEALRTIEKDSHGTVKVLRTSGLWQTKAMYVLDQDDFVNGVCEIDTCLPPANLLSYLQSIENSLGRVKVIDKGPRCIDLDILLYGGETVNSDRLTVPHALMLEREFVLRPLSELIPNQTIPHPLARGTVAQHLSWLPPSSPAPTSLFPLFKSLPTFLPLDPSRRTSIMSILNTTPDSFSTDTPDTIISQSPDALRSRLLALRPHTHILDIGGQSTRPNASPVDAATETARILPAIEAAVELGFRAISVDTFDSAVASAAFKAGAHMVNDISGGVLDPKILSVVAEHDGAVVLMHSRGTPETMSSPPQNVYHPGEDGDVEAGLIDTVAIELRRRIDAAEAAGVRRWKIMLDPGIGFAKTATQNLILLRRFGELKSHPAVAGFPWLVGVSNKRFIGKITGVEKASERGWGTAGAIAAAVAGGADVVRVHEPEGMTAVTKMADAIWRGCDVDIDVD